MSRPRSVGATLGAGLACAVSVCAVSRAAPAPKFCASALEDQRMAVWNTCYPSERDDSAASNLSSSDGLAPRALIASFERILAVAAGQLDASRDRVAVAEPGGAVWVLTDRAKARLDPPELISLGTYPFGGFTPRFDPKDGSLMLFGDGVTAWCGGTDGVWRWRWRERWVLESDPFEPHGDANWSRTPLSSIPELPGYDRESGAAELRDATGRYWLAGDQGVFVYDQDKWWHVAAAPPGVTSMAAQGKARIWFASAHGLYRATLLPTLSPIAAPPRVLVPIAKHAPSPSGQRTFPETELRGATVRRVSFAVRGGEPLDAATFVLAGAEGTLHFVNGRRVVTVRGGVATSRALGSVSPPAQAFNPSPAKAFAIAKGEPWLVLGDDLVTEKGAGARTTGTEAYSPSSLAMSDDAGWLLTCRAGDANPTARRWDGARWDDVPGFPQACFHAVSLGGRNTAWMAGGLGIQGSWPTGPGVLVHARGSSVQAYGVPEGSLLTVAALGDEEVYAGGYDGLLVHRRGKAQTAFRVRGDPWILGLQARGDRVAIVGEGLVGLIERERLLRVPARLFPPGTWRSAAFDSEGTLWVVGDPGIFRVSP